MKFLSRVLLNEQVIIYAIILNSIVLFMLGFPSLADSIYLERIDLLFTIFFLLEAIFKIRMYGWYLYIRNSWNRFDFILVIISIPSLFELTHIFPDISFLLAFRLLRILRILRFLRFIPNIMQMFNGITRAFKASVFVLIVLLIYNVLLSVISTFLFSEVSPTHFGNPMLSMYSIFQIFTVEGWNDLPYEVLSNVPDDAHLMQGFVRVFFVLVVLSGGIFGFSIVNAIFVDEMIQDNNNDLEQKIDELNRKIDRLIGEKEDKSLD